MFGQSIYILHICYILVENTQKHKSLLSFLFKKKTMHKKFLKAEICLNDFIIYIVNQELILFSSYMSFKN